MPERATAMIQRCALECAGSHRLRDPTAAAFCQKSRSARLLSASTATAVTIAPSRVRRVPPVVRSHSRRVLSAEPGARLPCASTATALTEFVCPASVSRLSPVAIPQPQRVVVRAGEGAAVKASTATERIHPCALEGPRGLSGDSSCSVLSKSRRRDCRLSAPLPLPTRVPNQDLWRGPPGGVSEANLGLSHARLGPFLAPATKAPIAGPSAPYSRPSN